ncbi:MaoC family dehydratase [Limibacillus halophilus]|jgi:3-hydroxybutyryl-CoA dehydratase
MQELHGHYIEELEAGMTAVYAKTVTEADIALFAGVSGDTNPVHLNADFAAGTMFKERIAHGMLSASFISTVFGTRLPGPGCIYLSQTLNFKAPVMIGDTVVARVTLREVNKEKKRILVDTVCSVGDKVVLDGEAKLMVASRAQAQASNDTKTVAAE